MQRQVILAKKKPERAIALAKGKTYSKNILITEQAASGSQKY